MAFTTINNGSLFMNTKLYTGDSASSRTIAGIGFEPSLTWNKPRTTANDHQWVDAVRGGGKVISSNLADAEYTAGNTILSFNSDGFTCGDGASVNANGVDYVSWNWKANGAGSANTDGSINTTYTSANTTAGFSIIKYAGTGSSGTIGHGLTTPKVLIIKEIDGAESWRVWHRDAPNYSTKALSLNSTSAEFSQSNWIGTVDNSIITLGTDSSINTSGNNYICYAFAEKQGFSKFSSYIGNGNDDGTFIYTGFKPSFIMIKATGLTENWWIMDSKRSPSNVVQNLLQANLSNAELVGNVNFKFDMLSNGFKLRDVDGAYNSSGQNYIYMAFAEAPIVGTNNIPANAR